MIKEDIIPPFQEEGFDPDDKSTYFNEEEYIKKIGVNQEHNNYLLPSDVYSSIFDERITTLSFKAAIEINSELHDLIKDEIYLETKNKKIGDKNNSIPDINAQKFVERVEPFIDKNSKEPKISVRIPIYKIVATLKTGDTFGEVALSKMEVEERKRTALYNKVYGKKKN